MASCAFAPSRSAMNPPSEKVPPPPREHWKRPVIRQVAILALVAALGAIGYVGHHALKLMGPPERCWEYQEVEGKLYKVNPCTGQFLLMGDVAPPVGDK